MEEELEKIKNKILDDFIVVLKNNGGNSRFDKVFSYEEIYKVISSLHYKR